MADLKIPNLNKNSDKFIFKKKLSLRRKSKNKLIKESLFMFFFGFLIIYLNYLLPNKNLIVVNFFDNINKFFSQIFDLFTYLYEICLVFLIIVSLIFSLILILGAFSRLVKVAKRKSKQIKFK